MYTFYNVVDTIDQTKLNVLERYLILRTLEELTSNEPDLEKIKECLMELFDRIPMKTNSLNMIHIDTVTNEHILKHLEMFSKLTSYSRNPLEPLFIILVKDHDHKKVFSDCITEICRGQIFKAFTMITKLTHEITKED